MRPNVLALVVLLCVAVGAVVISCSDDDGSASEAASNPCDALQELRSSLVSLTEVRDADEIDEALNEVKDDAAAVREASREAGGDASNELSSWVEEFNSELDAAQASERPLARTITVVGETLAELERTLEEVRSQSGC